MKEEKIKNNTGFHETSHGSDYDVDKAFEGQISEIKRKQFESLKEMNQKLSDIQLNPMHQQTTFDKICVIMNAMRDLLQYKNHKYGDSALYPNNIFYKGDSTNSILIRLDDKLGRVRNNPELAYNDVCDIIGYCTLLLISMGITKEDIEKLKD